MSTNKKTAVKRTGKNGKRTGLNYVQQMSRNMLGSYKEGMSHGKIIGQIYMILALGRMGFGKKRMMDLHKIHKEVLKDYSKLASEDVESDSDTIYTRAVMWRELATVIDNLPTYEECFDIQEYTEGIRLIELNEIKEKKNHELKSEN